MRVNISYSVELDEVPMAVSNMIMQLHSSCESLYAQMAELQISLRTRPNVEESLREIDNIRQQLFKADQGLVDCTSILAGYQKALSGAYLQEEIREEEQVDGEESLDD